MKDLWNYLKNTQKPIVLYGMGDGAEKIISACNSYGIKISGVFSSDGFVRNGKMFKGFPVTDYSTAKRMFGDMVVLLCFGTPLKSVLENIKKIASENTLFAPDVPVWGGPLFNSQFYEENKSSLDAVYNMLADDTSKLVFENTVKYKLSGEIDYLFNCETDNEEAYKFLNLSDNEVFVDLGAYRGDTVMEFISHTNGYNGIIAVEPDKKTFKKLISNTENLKNFTAYNAAVCNTDNGVRFSSEGSRGSGIGAGDFIESVTVDSIANNGCTYIKMDVEGAELLAINGAINTIKKYHPKMKIAAYHKSEDIFKIPLAVKNIHPHYKVYMRHLPCLPAWDTDFYFIPDKF